MKVRELILSGSSGVREEPAWLWHLAVLSYVVGNCWKFDVGGWLVQRVGLGSGYKEGLRETWKVND